MTQRKAGVRTIAAKDADAAQLHERFDHLNPGEETGEQASVAGRVMLLRRQGKLSFITLRDATGARQTADDFSFIVRNGELIQRPHAATEYEHDVARTYQDHITTL